MLIVDDDRDRGALYDAWLEAECEARVVHDGPGALDALDPRVDVVVLGPSLLDARIDSLRGRLDETLDT